MRLKDAERAIVQTEEAVQSKEEEVKQSERSVLNSKKRLPVASEELKQVSEEEANLSRLRQDLRLRVEEGKSSLAAAKSGDVVLDNLMKLKKKGVLAGVQVCRCALI